MLKQYKLLTSLLLIITIAIGCEKEVSVTPEPGPVPEGNLIIKSIPSGSKVYINGRYSLKDTPASFEFLEYGDYEITLKRDLHLDTTFTVTAVENQVTEVNIDYYKNPKMLGGIGCFSDPLGAEIFVNDSATGRLTPDTLYGYIPGEHKIKYRAVDHYDGSLIVTVRSSQVAEAEIALADTTVWVNYDESNSNIPTNFLYAVDVDNNGTAWVGTNGLGAAKLEGNEWTQYTSSNSDLPSDVVNAIEIDSDNNVWIGTLKGVAKFDGVSWEIFNRFNSPLTNDSINTINITNGDVWIGTRDGFAKLNGGEWATYNTPRPPLAKIPGNYTTALAVDFLGTVWIGTDRNGFAAFDGSEYEYYYAFISGGAVGRHPGNAVSSIAVSKLPYKEVWIANVPKTYNGFYVGEGGMTFYDYERVRRYGVYKGFVSNQINVIIIDDNNYKWVGTDQGFVKFKYYDSRVLFNKDNSSMTFDDVRDLVKDSRNQIWIATYGSGLVKYKGN